jgi:PKD repeat protein
VTTRSAVRRGRGDAGTTLIELLLYISISTVVIGAAAMALMVAFKTTGATVDSFAESNDSELIAVYFVPDAQSATLVGQAIDTGCAAQGSTDVLRLQGPGFSVGYRLDGGVLTRWICESGTTRSHIVARHLTDVIPWSTGGHQVAVTVVAASGHSFSLVGTQRTGTVDLPLPPTPNVAPVAVLGVDCLHLRCQLDGGDSSDSDGAVTSYLWDLGDGTTATTSLVDHTYAVAGTYATRLTVVDDDGATAVVTNALTVVANQAPTAAFTVSCTGRDCSVDGSTSTDVDGAVTALVWGWGDGTANGAGSTATHSYTTSGAKTITLAVTDNEGAIGSTTRPVTLNLAPTASFTLSCAGRLCTVNGTASSDPDGTISAYAWGWGDGTANGSGSSTTHTFTTSGSKTVTLTVTDSSGGTAATTRTANVNLAPTAAFTIDTCNLAVCAVSATTSTDADGTIASYSWAWADGTANGTASSTTHAYSALGARTIVLTVTDDDGATATASTVVTPPVLLIATGTPSFTATLSWTPASLSLTVDVFRNGVALISGDANDGTYVRFNATKTNVNGSYKVCEHAGLKRCTNTVVVAL